MKWVALTLAIAVAWLSLEMYALECRVTLLLNNREIQTRYIRALELALERTEGHFSLAVSTADQCILALQKTAQRLGLDRPDLLATIGGVGGENDTGMLLVCDTSTDTGAPEVYEGSSGALGVWQVQGSSDR